MATLTGKVALVTGGSRGIGRAISERLARDGALVAVHYGRDAQAAANTVKAIDAAGGRAFAVEAELGVAGDVATLFGRLDAELQERTGSNHLDIVVNNAGIATTLDLEHTTPEAFDELFAVNARAPFFITQAAVERMRAGGRVIGISTGATRQALPDLVAYAMSKGALDVMGLTLAKALAPRGITVNTLAPGLVDTDMNADWLRTSDEARAEGAAMSAFNRVGEPDDIAGAVAFLASDDARWVTGHYLDVTGGSLL
jgi:NAD(P)-dependent dehydrogenase (short-subunit alcohol dehydrogenase family)